MTLPNAHSFCGEVHYEVLFEGKFVQVNSSPMGYDSVTRTFEIYSEDFDLIGPRTIEVRGFLKDYPSMRAELPNLTTSIEILDPCPTPTSISDPGQLTEVTYDYSVQGLRFKLNDLVVDPYICPASYECVSIEDPSSSLTCDSRQVFQVDNKSGLITVKTTDMATYKPGDYPVIIRGSSGTVAPVTVDVTFTLRLVDPCPTARLSNLQKDPIFSVKYSLGDEPIN